MCAATVTRAVIYALARETIIQRKIRGDTDNLLTHDFATLHKHIVAENLSVDLPGITLYPSTYVNRLGDVLLHDDAATYQTEAARCWERYRQGGSAA
jgi:hypothetical protein